MSSMLETAPSVVAVGAQMFTDALAGQAVPAQQVPWRPPLGEPGIEDSIARILADPRHREANVTAVGRLLAAGVRSSTPVRRSAGPGPPDRCAAR